MGGEGERGREGNRSMGKMANEISFVCSVIADSAPGVFGRRNSTGHPSLLLLARPA